MRVWRSSKGGKPTVEVELSEDESADLEAILAYLVRARRTIMGWSPGQRHVMQELLDGMRHAAPATGVEPLVFQDLVIDPNTYEVTVRGQRVRCTPHEFRLLCELASSPNQLVSTQQLRANVWGSDWSATNNDLKALVHRLRLKLRPSAGQTQFIETHPRRGYRFVVPCSGEH